MSFFEALLCWDNCLQHSAAPSQTPKSPRSPPFPPVPTPVPSPFLKQLMSRARGLNLEQSVNMKRWRACSPILKANPRNSLGVGSSQNWSFQTWLFAIFAIFGNLLRPFAPFCVLLRLRSFALFCARLCVFCFRPRLEQPHLGTAEG